MICKTKDKSRYGLQITTSESIYIYPPAAFMLVCVYEWEASVVSYLYFCMKLHKDNKHKMLWHLYLLHTDNVWQHVCASSERKENEDSHGRSMKNKLSM